MFNPQNQNTIRLKMLFLIFKFSILILCFHSSSPRSMSLRSSSSSNIAFSWRSFSSSSSSTISSMSLSFAVIVDFPFLSTLVFKFLGPIKETKKYIISVFLYFFILFTFLAFSIYRQKKARFFSQTFHSPIHDASFSIQRDLSFTLTLVGFGDFSFSSDPSITMNRYNGNESRITRFKCDSNDSLCDSGHKTVHILIRIVLSSFWNESRYVSYDSYDTNYHGLEDYLPLLTK